VLRFFKQINIALILLRKNLKSLLSITIQACLIVIFIYPSCESIFKLVNIKNGLN